MTYESKLAANGRVMYFAVDENGKKKHVKFSPFVAIQIIEENEARDKAERDELLSTPLVTVEAHDAATDAEIENANADNKFDENNVDDIDTINTESTGYIFTKVLVRKGFDKGGYYSRLEEISSFCQILGDKNNFDNSVYREVVFFDEELCQSWELKSADGTLLAKGTSRNDALKIFANIAVNEINPDDYAVTIEAQDAATDAEISAANTYQPQTNWENPHDFTITGDLSNRNINGRIIAANIAHEQEKELAEIKADGIKFLLKIKVPQMHTYRKFNFETVINPYKSLDALKKFGGNRIHEHEWRIETIDGKLIAKGIGSDEFNNFCNANEIAQIFDECTVTAAAQDEAIKAEMVNVVTASLLAKDPEYKMQIAIYELNCGAELNGQIQSCFVVSASKINKNGRKTFLATNSIDFNRAEKARDIYREFGYDARISFFDKCEVTHTPTYYMPEDDGSNDDPDEDEIPGIATVEGSENTAQSTSDSLIRAMQINLEKVQNACRDKNIPAALAELELFRIYRVALFAPKCLSVAARKVCGNKAELEEVNIEGNKAETALTNINHDDFKTKKPELVGEQISDSLQRAIDKAKLEYKIACISGNQLKANFERELYLIAAKALHQLAGKIIREVKL